MQPEVGQVWATAATVVSVNLSRDKGTAKQPVPEICLDANGVVGDAHAGPGSRQVSILAEEVAQRFAAEVGRPVQAGEFGENLTVRGVDTAALGLLDRLMIGAAVLEITQFGKTCHGGNCAIFRKIGRCVMPVHGVFCRVIGGGTVRPGDTLRVVLRPLRFLIITLSDRVSRGEREDRSGPRIRALVEDFLRTQRWHPDIVTARLPDDADQLKRELLTAREAGVDVIITTGGTGVGSRDITPETVLAVADKMIPGIMEHIRQRFGRENPRALLSRGVAAVMGRSLVFTLPGSERAVVEYMGEILPLLEHLLLMMHDLDVH